MIGNVQVAVAGDVAEAEHLRGILASAGIESTFEMADEHLEGALDDPPLKVLVRELDADAARDAIEALAEPDATA
jgi:Putative prokaryotic signal transducing protein